MYGSAARGERGPESDYDVLILTDQSLSTADEDAIGDRVYDIELARGAVVSLIFYSRAQWSSVAFRSMPYRQAVERESVVI